MRIGLAPLASLAGVAAFASCGLSLALLGLGLPYVAGAALSGACAGILIYAVGRWSAAPGEAAAPAAYFPAPPPAPVVDDTAASRLAALEREMSSLRHELRGALSPALMVSDRLLRNDDPLIRRAGDAVVRSVERATALIGQDTPVRPAAAVSAVQAAAPPPP